MKVDSGSEGRPTRRTRQRDAVAEVLARAERPLTPAEIYEAASAGCDGLGLRTVYRHIREICQNGEAVGIDYPGQPRRYEAAGGQHHAHFICNTCRKVYDLPGRVSDLPVRAPPGFSVTGQETIFYGMCRTCAVEETNAMEAG